MIRKLSSYLGTALFSALLAAVIWLWAEGESVQVTTLAVPVTFVVPATADMVVEPENPAPLDVTIEASARQLRRLQELINAGPIEFTIPNNPNAPAIRRLVTRDILASAELERLGVTVRDVQPETLEVRAETMVEVSVPLRARADGVRLDGAATFNPASVLIRLPNSLSDLADNMTLDISLSDLDLEGLETNVAHTLPLDLSIPTALRSSWSRMLTNSAQVTLTLRSTTDSVMLPRVPVYINAPPMLLSRYDIELPERQRVLPDVELTGPRDVIERIRQRDPGSRVWAEIQPSEDDLAKGQSTLQLTLRVPPGVSVVSPIPTVTVTARPRTTVTNNSNGLP